MESQMANEDIKQAVKELGINVPVMATRMVGNRLELYLYGGRVVFWEPPNDYQATFDRVYLESLKVVELRSLAKQANIVDYNKLKKDQLIERLAG
jgi:hypothetical protein